MRYLILGSSGQIGLPLCNFLRESGHTVVEFDVVRDPAEDLRHGAELLRAKLSQADYVIFLAFDVGGSRYLKQYQKSFSFIDNNMRIMLTTFEALKDSKVPFTFASSQMANMSYSPYGSLKSVGEHYTTALGGLSVHFWNVYGPESDPAKYHAITDFCISALKQQRINLMTTGTETRQFLHVRDCARALYMVSQRHNELSAKKIPLHITSFNWVTILAIATHIAQIVGVKLKCDIPVIPGTDIDTVQLTRNEPDPAILEYWSPAISLGTGLQCIVQFNK